MTFFALKNASASFGARTVHVLCIKLHLKRRDRFFHQEYPFDYRLYYLFTLLKCQYALCLLISSIIPMKKFFFLLKNNSIFLFFIRILPILVAITVHVQGSISNFKKSKVNICAYIGEKDEFLAIVRLQNNKFHNTLTMSE